jgi:hypoxanthine-guanine phosphoribosyltransferase
MPAGARGELPGVVDARPDDLRDLVVVVVEDVVEEQGGTCSAVSDSSRTRKASESESAVSARAAGSFSGLSAIGSGSHSPT